MHKIEDKLIEVKDSIRESSRQSGRNPDDVTLLAVSKRQTPDSIREVYDLGQRHFGENYLQEALEKQEELHDTDILWHFIGPIQSNKTAAIATHFQWVHSVDRLKIAERLSRQRPTTSPPLELCLQVNIDLEESKSGIAPSDCLDLARDVMALPHIRLRGLMCIPSANRDGNALSPFLRLRQLFENIKATLEPEHFDTLSMGMSADMTEAIKEGATMVRVGTALFAPRD